MGVPFPNFKNTLYDFPDEQKACYSFHDDWLPQKAIEFIEDNKLGEIEKE